MSKQADKTHPRAEQAFAADSEAAKDSSMSDEKKLLHELQVHQMELEMQNVALQETRTAAEQAKDRYAELFDSAPIPYFTLDKAGIIRETNFRGERLLGAERAKLSGRHFSSFVCSEKQPDFHRFLEEVFASASARNCELSFQLDETPCCAALEAIADKTRQTCLLTVSDISERKKAERTSNILTALIDISFDGFWVVDATGKFSQANEAYTKVIGYSADELRNMHIHQLEANEDPAQVQAHMAKISAQGYDLFETRHRHKDGHIIDMEVSAAYLPEFQLFCGFCRDITQRVQSVAQLNAIFNASAEGIITHDLYNRVVSANPAVETIFGYAPDELVGSNIGALLPTFPKCRDDCRCLPGAAKATAHIVEINGVHKNGHPIPLELSNAEYVINNECFFVHIVRDISLRKRREQLDKAHLDELAHITRLGLMGEMASGIAHELNQPLAAISSYTQASINLINAESHDPANLADILLKTQQQALRAGQIVHRMREFIKAHPKQRSTVDINHLVREALNLCIEDIKHNNIQLTLDFISHPPPASADHIQIEQVIINLIRNGIDVLQTLPDTRPRQLSIHTQLTGQNSIMVRIKDNGPGMDKDQQQKILTPFYTTKATGMGMGLSICRSLIEAHEGILYFNSKPGKGSTFYFTLPVH
ncbi:MAG: PAS domain S-box protein [Methylomonas sp.]|jgi:PAS domain S-box-containing protein